VSAPGPSADLKRSDTLMSDAQAAQDPVTPLVAEARSNLERVVSGASLTPDHHYVQPSALVRVRAGGEGLPALTHQLHG
jgi:hypothetical protein